MSYMFVTDSENPYSKITPKNSWLGGYKYIFLYSNYFFINPSVTEGILKGRNLLHRGASGVLREGIHEFKRNALSVWFIAGPEG